MSKKHNEINATDPARGSSLMSIKMAQKAREEDEKTKQRRRKGMIVQVMQFLNDHGLHRTYDAMCAETQMNLQKFPPADNVDLTTIFSEYEEFVEYKFGRKPTFYRLNKDYDESAASGRTTSTPPTAAGTGTMMKNRNPSSSQLPPVAPPPSAQQQNQQQSGGAGAVAGGINGGNLDIRGVQASTAGTKPGMTVQRTNSSNNTNQQKFGFNNNNSASTGNSRDASDADDDLPGFQGRSNLLKPLPHFPTQELNDVAMTIHREILDRDPGVSFQDIAELDNAKQLLREACVMPARYPQFFTGILRPWSAVLLYGPPGTGKTMLARAVAAECKTTFFNISAASVVSKWRGDSEKLVRMLFDLAVHFAPSTVFIDELDSILSSRQNDGSEHEASKRLKTEFLIQMDGLSKRTAGEHVFVLAASNHPWSLEGALLRRMEKRIMVPLPSVTAREKMFRKLLTSTKPDFDFKKCAELTEGYSGADIDILCREAMMRSVRVLIRKLESSGANNNNNNQHLSNAPLAKPIVTLEDVIESTKVTRASHQTIPMHKYEEWEKKFGSTISSAQLEE